jgi:hypothetical protein
VTVNLSIGQEHSYVGNDYWKWSAWIKGKAADLAKVDKVKWFLHPSFPKSVVVSRDRDSGFRLETAGWGTFTLRAEVHCIDGSTETLRQPLRLLYPDSEVTAAERAAPSRGLTSATARREKADRGEAGAGVRRVFMSFASSDRPAAMAVRATLESLGLQVIDESSIEADRPIELAALDLLATADATVAFVSSDLPSAFVAGEIEASRKLGKPTLVLTSEDLSSIAGVASEVRVVRVDPTDAGAVSAAVATLIGAESPG